MRPFKKPKAAAEPPPAPPPAIFYCASTRGFYREDIHGQAIPADRVEVTPEEHHRLIHAQRDGFEIHPDETGRPVSVPIPAPTIERQWEVLRRLRNRRLAATDWTQLPDVPPAVKALWAGRRQYLRDLPANTTDPANPDWGEDPS